jgi:hypothetical protein
VLVVGNTRQIAHWDGGTWTVRDAPPDFDEPYFFDLWGTGPSDVYAVGGYGAIVHWNGSAWTAMASGTDADLHTIRATPTEIIVTGARSTILRRAR